MKGCAAHEKNLFEKVKSYYPSLYLSMGTSYENLGNYFEEKIPEEARHRTLNINQVLDSEFRVIDKTNKAVSAFKGLEDGTSQKRKTYRDWLIDSNVLYFPDNLGSKIAQVNQPRESHDIRPY